MPLLNDKHINRHFILLISIIFFSYLVYLFFKEDKVNILGKEDGFFEYLKALSFLVASMFFFMVFLDQREIVNVLFALIFFIGMGEEICWGQRVFNYGTPEFFKKIAFKMN